MRVLWAVVAAFFTFWVLTIGVSAFAGVGEVEIMLFGLIAVVVGFSVWRSKGTARTPTE